MAKNKIQFQKGMSFKDFMIRYGTEERCREELFRLRWPKGFECPNCGNVTYCELSRRNLLQCHSCHHQTSVTAGTIFHSSKLPLVTWFFAMYLLSQSKTGISALSLMRQIGASYNAAWRVKHKLMQVMLERGSARKLTGSIEIDDSYLGAKRVSGKRGRGAKGKTPFIAAVEKRDGNPVRIKLSRVRGFRSKEIERWSRHHLEPGTQVASDGLACFNAVKKAGCLHEPHIVGGGKQAVKHPAFKWVNTVLGNIKNSLKGTYHSFGKKHTARYLAEFQYRFNRRFELENMVPRLAYAAVRTPPMPARLLSLAEKEW
jgi:hypothetical protein